MKIETVIAAVAETEGSVEATFRDAAKIILVKIVALITFLAQTTKPVLADSPLVWISEES